MMITEEIFKYALCKEVDFPKTILKTYSTNRIVRAETGKSGGLEWATP